jgi:alpha-glucosidase
MKVDIRKVNQKRGTVYNIRVNDPSPPVSFKDLGFIQASELPYVTVLENYSIVKDTFKIVVQKDLGIREHILGMGERAFELDRRRITFSLWNIDVGGHYNWYTDPMYKSINFFISIDKQKILGFLFNNASKGIADIGNIIYDKISLGFVDNSLDFYILETSSMEELFELLSELTGYPFKLPEWSLGYQISRYSYYPSSTLINIIDEHLKEGVPISVVYLDIDYMEQYKMFTWDKNKFPDPKSLIEELHKRNVRVVTIFSPCLKVDQSYPPFREALGLYVENKNGEIYIDDMWPGKCAWIDFFSNEAKEWWSRKTEEWIKEYNVDGIWIDMNEPAVLGKGTFGESFHKGIPHELLHNAYGLKEVEATFDGFRRTGKDPFILSRSGYLGIHKYAVVWTGDNVSSWDDLRLQLSLTLSLSISGVPYVGFDIGGFSGRESGIRTSRDYELLLRYFQAALFMPLFRNHKAKGGEDQEIYILPEPWRKRIKDVIKLRYEFLPYIKKLVDEANEKGHPVLRPLPYYFPQDDSSYRCDEFMVGSSILFAPILQKGTNRREVYLPKGKWANLQGDIFEGENSVDSIDDLPIFVRQGYSIETASKFINFTDNKLILIDKK